MRLLGGLRRLRQPSRARERLAPLVLVLVCVLAACASTAPSASRVSPSTPTRTATPGPPQRPVRLGPTEPGAQLSISLVLRSLAPGALDRALAEIADPRSSQYRHYLTPQQIANRYGPDPAMVARVSALLRADGLTVGPLDGLQLGAQGTAGQLEALFHLTLSEYRAANGSVYQVPDATPRLPDAFHGDVTGLLGLDTRPAVHTGARLTPASASFVTGVSGLGPSDLASAYNITPLQQAGLSGSNQTVALPEIDTFRMSDVQSYDQTFGLSTQPLEIVRVGRGASGTSPEPVLDIEVVHAVAPRAHIIVYESRQDLGSVAQMFSRIVSDNRARVVSISLGTCERGLDPSFANSFISTLDDTFKRADAQGMSVLVASGDSGAYDCQNSELSVGAVTANPYVTSVGGTALFRGSNGGYGREAGWEGPLEGAGGGGGVSIFYRRPAWQTGPGVDNQYSNGMRQVPDVSADADPLTGYAVYYSGGGCSGITCWHIVGGTSAATPLWAGIITLAHQRAGRPLGFLNPGLYRLGAGGGAGAFHDVTLGGNLYYNALPNWDYSTGWGSPDAARVVAGLVG